MTDEYITKNNAITAALYATDLTRSQIADIVECIRLVKAEDVKPIIHTNKELETCWVVTIYNIWDSSEPVVTVFNNREAAVKYHNYCLTTNKDNIGQAVCIDKCPVYNNFLTGDETG